jgi:hypothetical protein
VVPLCPTMTDTGVSAGEASTKNWAAQTMSILEILNRRRGSKTPAFSRVSETMRTVGFKMTKMCAVGATRVTGVAKSRTLDASV